MDVEKFSGEDKSQDVSKWLKKLTLWTKYRPLAKSTSITPSILFVNTVFLNVTGFAEEYLNSIPEAERIFALEDDYKTEDEATP